ncbi:hypothetical protein A3B51_01415 [Candidatus Curtissbacteria bacterium RIFCSPLOWO2_01_FULL_41_18]|uniref:Peptidase S9 prolyl oligopeptidase catalytic domain-containing protein n=1 Tax=Candidatus Curtissbacteria bacterium RIFCSPLOWO2_01_FULL_41_18 TaxID=1797727 RepID=A0A1F5HIE2_9BACT|nr:MAG: hypothetical protein A3B51_01415 [Candidatus Curtissbacteria bacterium RIFCSPLOWO2_01_FULL_41_18]
MRIQIRPYTFENDGLRLDGTIFKPPDEKDKHPAILFVHGWTSERKRSFQYAKSLADLGYICLLFDMRGHGTSEGDINKATTKESLDDVLAAYDYLLQVEGVDKENISAVGSSFGGYLVTLLTTKRNVKRLVLRVPAEYPNSDFKKSKMQTSGGEDPAVYAWRNQHRKSRETFALEAVSNFKSKILIIESEKDDVIPHQVIENYINAIKDKSKLTHIVMKNAHHSIKEGPFRDEVERILVKWFGNRF